MKNIKTFESFDSTNETTGEVFSSPTGRSGLGGQTLGTSWASGGGEPGQVSVPYNPSGSNRVFQKIAAPEMGKNHGAHTGKKSREKKLDMKTLKSMFARRQDYTAGEGEVDGEKERPSKVMSFDNFTKDDINTIKKESVNDVVLVEKGQPIVAYQIDVENNTLSLNDGYFTGTAIIGSESAEDKGSVNFSSPFHTGQVLHDEDDDEVEEMDFKFHESIPENIVRKHLDEFVSKGYNGKIVKIYYH